MAKRPKARPKARPTMRLWLEWVLGGFKVCVHSMEPDEYRKDIGWLSDGGLVWCCRELVEGVFGPIPPKPYLLEVNLRTGKRTVWEPREG